MEEKNAPQFPADLKFERLPRQMSDIVETKPIESSELYPLKLRLLKIAKLFAQLHEQDNEEMRYNQPEHVYMVNLKWLTKLKEYLLWDPVKPTVDEASFCALISPRHLVEGHPGEMNNKALLKCFTKYVRDATADELEPEDLVCSKKIREDTDYVLVADTFWAFLTHCFGADFTLRREKDSGYQNSFQASYAI